MIQVFGDSDALERKPGFWDWFDLESRSRIFFLVDRVFRWVLKNVVATPERVTEAQTEESGKLDR